jgi:hypothetical protein
MSFSEVLQEHFPGSSPQEVFVRRAAVSLIQDHGFSPANTLACVGHCRDELCRRLSEEVEAMWGQAFDFSSLAGILTLGTTGFAAARTHAPVIGGRRRYLFFVFAHIGIASDGTVGVAARPGVSEPTPACGALVALLDDLRAGHRGHSGGPLDWQDPEQSLLKMRVRKITDLAENPGLLELTKAVHRATLLDLETLVATAFDLESEDLGVIAGVQIHGPDGTTFIWPAATYLVIRGVRSEIWV